MPSLAGRALDRLRRSIDLRAARAVAEAEGRLWRALDDVRLEALAAAFRLAEDVGGSLEQIEENRLGDRQLDAESMTMRFDDVARQRDEVVRQCHELQALVTTTAAEHAAHVELRFNDVQTAATAKHKRMDDSLNALRSVATGVIATITDDQRALGTLVEQLDRRMRWLEIEARRPPLVSTSNTDYEVVSYAQNQEDVVLSRLTHVVETGVFIDVGAGHPVTENVTYALYRAGWRGVNIEPMEREVKMFAVERPDDDIVQAAAGSAPGMVTLYEAPLENRGATTSNRALAEHYERSGQEFTTFESPVITLASILQRFEIGDVHVVKIDVEGMEPEVLAGAELSTYRPWVLVIEATKPNAPDDVAGEWEPEVLDAGYRLVLFDGLNRFYVRDDLPAIAELLARPANVFDHWISYTVLERDELLRSASAFAAEMERQRDDAERYARSLEAAVADLRAGSSAS